MCQVEANFKKVQLVLELPVDEQAAKLEAVLQFDDEMVTDDSETEIDTNSFLAFSS